MRKIEYRLRDRCSGCGVQFLAGTFRSPASKNEVWLGDLISPQESTCPRCGARVGVAVEVEWPEHCGLCPNEPHVFWQPRDRVTIGLCHACYRLEAGQRWVDSQLEEGKKA